MEYVDGESLAALLRHTKPPLPVCARIVATAAGGLHAAHELRDRNGMLQNVVHRDVSPQNVLLSYEGAVKVVDFGVARARGNIHTTSVGTLKGKFAYMAPEQATLAEVDRRADIFALGILLYETTTRTRLFKAESEQATIMRVTTGAITPPSQVVSNYPAALEQIVMKALQRDPDKRYQTAEQLQAALESFIIRTRSLVLPSVLGKLMRETFAERIRRKREVLRQFEADQPML